MQPKGPIAGRGALGASGGAPPMLLLTGCNDHGLRLWDVAQEELVCIKSEHKARVNAIAWPSETSIFSADAAGVLRQWELTSTEPANLKLISTIAKKELEGAPINSIVLHPSRRRLLLQTRKNQLLALDTRLQHFSQRYSGHRVTEYNLRATYSPDGRFVVAGSESGAVFAWAEESGALLLDGLKVDTSAPPPLHPLPHPHPHPQSHRHSKPKSSPELTFATNPTPSPEPNLEPNLKPNLGPPPRWASLGHCCSPSGRPPSTSSRCARTARTPLR